MDSKNTVKHSELPWSVESVSPYDEPYYSITSNGREVADIQNGNLYDDINKLVEQAEAALAKAEQA